MLSLKGFSSFFFGIRISLWNSLEKSCSLYTNDIHQIGCRSAKFLWKSKFSLGSGSWFSFGFHYQTYISYIDDTDRILFESANFFEIYCVHSKSRRTDRQTDRQTDFFLLVLPSKTYKTWTFIRRREFFFLLMRLQYFLFLHLRMS